MGRRTRELLSRNCYYLMIKEGECKSFFDGVKRLHLQAGEVGEDGTVEMKGM